MKLRAIGTITLITSMIFLLVTFNEVSKIESTQKQAAGRIQDFRSLHFGAENSPQENIDITASDVQIAAWKTRMAADVLEKLWSDQFARNGRRYYPPRLVTSQGAAYSACGPVQDAVYCSGDHSIYLNLYFMAAIMKGVGARQNTDGDMAVVTITAHEWGHAVQRQTRGLNGISKVNELNADCLAGAFTLFSYQNGMLETGDFEEAFIALDAGGDEQPWFAPNAHGSGEERIAAFKGGFRGGVPYCGVF